MLSCNRRRAMRRVAQDACARSSGDRAAAFEAAGRGFESLRARHGFRNISTSSTRGPARGSPGTGGAAPRGPGRSSRAAALPPARPGALPAGAELSTGQSSEVRRVSFPDPSGVGGPCAPRGASPGRAASPEPPPPPRGGVGGGGARGRRAPRPVHPGRPRDCPPGPRRGGDPPLESPPGRARPHPGRGRGPAEGTRARRNRREEPRADPCGPRRQPEPYGLRRPSGRGRAPGGRTGVRPPAPLRRSPHDAEGGGRLPHGVPHPRAAGGVPGHPQRAVLQRDRGQFRAAARPVGVLQLGGAPRDDAGEHPLAVDGHGTDDLVSSEVQLLLIGAPGTTVHVTVRRGAEVFTVALVRASIHRPVVRSQMLPGGIGYLKLYGYPDGSAGAIREALSGLLQARPRALIVDLRENGGGLVREFLATISLFLPPGTVVFREIRRDGIPRVGRTAGETIVPSALPLVALIDLGTASNGELTAAALRENRGVPLIGERTAGELEYSTLEVLSDGSAVRVAYARIETSRGVTIEGHGYPPDFEVPLDPTSVRDVQLEWAVRWVLEHLGGEAPGWREPAVAGVSSAGPGLLLCDVHVPGHPDEESEGGEVDKSG